MKRQVGVGIVVCDQERAGRAVPSPLAQLFSLCQQRTHSLRSLLVHCGDTEQLAGIGQSIDLKALTSFHHPPEFDLIVCAFAKGREPGPELLAALQYCRMLLQPGGRLCLLLPGEIHRHWHHFLFAHFSFGRSIGRRCPRGALLIQAGFVDVRKQVRPGLGRVISAQRPNRKW